MIGKILCGNDPEKTRIALQYARRHEADWTSRMDDPHAIYALFIDGHVMSWASAEEGVYESAMEPDITAQVFGGAKDDAKKPRLTLVPMQIVFDVAEVREYGNKKYGDPDNWKTVEPERYREAAFRHFLRYIDNPDGVDAESGLKHLAHLACNIAFLCALAKGGDGNEAKKLE